MSKKYLITVGFAVGVLGVASNVQAETSFPTRKACEDNAATRSSRGTSGVLWNPCVPHYMAPAKTYSITYACTYNPAADPVQPYQLYVAESVTDDYELAWKESFKGGTREECKAVAYVRSHSYASNGICVTNQNREILVQTGIYTNSTVANFSYTVQNASVIGPNGHGYGGTSVRRAYAAPRTSNCTQFSQEIVPVSDVQNFYTWESF